MPVKFAKETLKVFVYQPPNTIQEITIREIVDQIRARGIGTDRSPPHWFTTIRPAKDIFATFSDPDCWIYFFMTNQRTLHAAPSKRHHQ